ncbi:lysosomal protective protein-like [Dermatophagoides pteronyssinus]|uniref:lysosomal protective protein-like n=1 Tax=Dermatophagoides pteronyssinus TaxID=6956 RepID=UPI003F668B11
MSLLNIAALLSTLTATNYSSTISTFHQQQQQQRLISDNYNNADLVNNLNGLNFQPKFNHYSGFLTALDDVYLHYWFFESEHQPLNDPLVLWLNGGPGCSSLVGALEENGPFIINKDFTIDYNPNTWTTHVNMLYIESPAQVGFSYKLDQNYQTDDNETAYNNLAALKNFFEKFPHLKNNDFYIAGESYAGIFIPMLATLIIEQRLPTIRLKGFALGNPLLNLQTNMESQFFYLYSHGIIDTKTWSNILKFCPCYGHRKPMSSYLSQPNDLKMKRNCNNENDLSYYCQDAMKMIEYYVTSFDLNLYNINKDCKQNDDDNDDESTKYYWQESLKKFNKIVLPLPCLLDDHPITDWLNQQSVKKSLHVPLEFRWAFCNKVDYDREKFTVHNEILKLIDLGINGLIFAGDLDVVCNFIGIQWSIEDLRLLPINNHTYWKLNNNNNKIGGFYHNYRSMESNGGYLTFATVRGAGHSSATDKPSETKDLFLKFLNKKI